jgi:hypothetical protein
MYHAARGKLGGRGRKRPLLTPDPPTAMDRLPRGRTQANGQSLSGKGGYANVDQSATAARPVDRGDPAGAAAGCQPRNCVGAAGSAAVSRIVVALIAAVLAVVGCAGANPDASPPGGASGYGTAHRGASGDRAWFVYRRWVSVSAPGSRHRYGRSSARPMRTRAPVRSRMTPTSGHQS